MRSFPIIAVCLLGCAEGVPSLHESTELTVQNTGGVYVPTGGTETGGASTGGRTYDQTGGRATGGQQTIDVGSGGTIDAGDRGGSAGSSTGGQSTGGADDGGFAGANDGGAGGAVADDCVPGSSPECPASSCQEADVPSETTEGRGLLGDLFWIDTGVGVYQLFCKRKEGEIWTLIYSSDGRPEGCTLESDSVDYWDHEYLTPEITKGLAETATRVAVVSSEELVGGEGGEHVIISQPAYIPIVNLRNLESLFNNGGWQYNNWYGEMALYLEMSCKMTSPPLNIPEPDGTNYPTLFHGCFSADRCRSTWNQPNWTRSAKMRFYVNAG